MKKGSARRLVIISGLSGAGKTIALNTLEDLGFYCMDNLPVTLLLEFAGQIKRGIIRTAPEIAIGIDARTPASDIGSLSDVITDLDKQGLHTDLVFMEANDDILTRRFSETRRKHPLSSRSVPLSKAINKERRIMGELAELADIRIDTSFSQMHELRELVRKRIARRPQSVLSIQFTSFGYKHGLPRDADFVFDARCLPNPYWKKSLRGLTGRDKAVIRFLSGQKYVKKMTDHLIAFLSSWIPQFEADNRSYLCIAVGCTGGHHRSVYIVEQLSEHFRRKGKHVIINHRDI
jgi:UPF0042 nucleotide-binding protein